MWTIILIIAAAVIFAVLMALVADLSSGWERALVAALAFAIFGVLLSYLAARRKKN